MLLIKNSAGEEIWIKHGQGTMTYLKTGDFYIGQWDNNRIQGEGRH